MHCLSAEEEKNGSFGTTTFLMERDVVSLLRFASASHDVRPLDSEEGV